MQGGNAETYKLLEEAHRVLSNPATRRGYAPSQNPSKPLLILAGTTQPRVRMHEPRDLKTFDRWAVRTYKVSLSLLSPRHGIAHPCATLCSPLHSIQWVPALLEAFLSPLHPICPAIVQPPATSMPHRSCPAQHLYITCTAPRLQCISSNSQRHPLGSRAPFPITAWTRRSRVGTANRRRNWESPRSTRRTIMEYQFRTCVCVCVATTRWEFLRGG